MFVVVSGMSGAGKSQAVKALEDIGFYCVDNLPPKLLPTFAELCLQSSESLSRVALVADIRGGESFAELPQNIQSLKENGNECKVLFLDCDDTVLARRYKETRRQHPLFHKAGDTVSRAIAYERELLQPVRVCTDYLIDTTHLSTAQLKQRISELFMEDTSEGMWAECMSFGFKYGYPAEADLVFDVRCFPNPFYIPELKHKTGLDSEVRDFVLSSKEMDGFLERLYSLMDYLLPLYQGEGKSRLVIAVGCTGGKHRSVTVAQALAEHMASLGVPTHTHHRDIQKN